MNVIVVFHRTTACPLGILMVGDKLTYIQNIYFNEFFVYDTEVISISKFTKNKCVLFQTGM